MTSTSSTRTRRLVAALAAAALSAIIGITVAAPSALAAPARNTESHADDVKWSVAPADADGPDGRRWVETTVPPGGEVAEHMAVRNLSGDELTFAITAADGYLTDSGRFAMLTPDRESVDAGLWITVPDTVTVAPGATAIVDVTVAVPDDAKPGEHLGAVAASIRSVGTDASGASVGVDSRMGFRVVIDVSGEAKPALALTHASSEYEMSWNPFVPGRLVVGMTAENTGSVDLALTPAARAQGHVTERPDDGPLGPGASRTYRIAVDGVWPWGPVDVVASASGDAVEFRSADHARAERDASVWIMPWPQLALLAAVLTVGAIVLMIVRSRARARRRWDERIAAARAEGAREALAGNDAAPPAP